MQRYTVDEVAQILGIESESVRKLIAEGTLRSEIEGGTQYIWLDQSGDIGPNISITTLISAKDETIRVLHEQLEAERIASSELRRIVIAALPHRTPKVESIERPLAAPENATGRADEEEVPTDGSGGWQSQEVSSYHPEPGFLPSLKDRLPWWPYALVLCMVGVWQALVSNSNLNMNETETTNVKLVDLQLFLSIIIVSWVMFAFWVGLRKRRFPWLMIGFMALFIASEQILVHAIVQSVYSMGHIFNLEFTEALNESLLSWRDWVSEFNSGIEEALWPAWPLVPIRLYSWPFFFLLAGALLGKAVQRRGLNLGLYRDESTVRDPHATKAPSPLLLAILSLLATVIGSSITATATIGASNSN